MNAIITTANPAGGSPVTDDNEQLKYWRIQAATLSQALREQKKQYEKELSETRTQLAYWREIALENGK